MQILQDGGFLARVPRPRVLLRVVLPQRREWHRADNELEGRRIIDLRNGLGSVTEGNSENEPCSAIREMLLAVCRPA